MLKNDIVTCKRLSNFESGTLTSSLSLFLTGASTSSVSWRKDNTVKLVLSRHTKIDKTKVLQTGGSLVRVKCIAECSTEWSILQYFWPALCDYALCDSRKRGSSVVSAFASGARGPWFDPCSRREKFRSPNTLFLLSFAGISASSFRSGR